MLKYISNSEHYKEVLAHCKDVKHDLWIGTADIKDAYIDEDGKKARVLRRADKKEIANKPDKNIHQLTS